MRWRRLLAAMFVVGLTFGAAVAGATLSQALSLRELVRRADHVVLATAVGEHARRDARRRIVTDYTVRVDDVLAGDARLGTTLVMTKLGGELGDLGMRIEGEPSLQAGRRYLLFLAQMSDGRTLRPVGMSQGVLPVQEQDGVAIVLPGGDGLSLVQQVQGGRLAPAPGALVHPERWLDLRQRIGAMVAEERRGAVRP